MLKILDDIEIKDNEIFGFVGLIDSGRTTILKNIYKKNSQLITYIDKLPELSFLKVKTILGKNRKHEYVKRLDLNTDKRISNLNYSETRKLLFLLSIFTNKKIVILDEPLLLIDEETKKRMLEIMREVNKTFLISLDNLTEAKLICDKYAIVKDYKVLDVKDNKKEQDIYKISIKASNINKASLPLKNMKINNFTSDELEFIYKGNINELLKYLITIKIDFIEIQNADLKDLYKYYLKK